MVVLIVSFLTTWSTAFPFVPYSQKVYDSHSHNLIERKPNAISLQQATEIPRFLLTLFADYPKLYLMLIDVFCLALHLQPIIS